MSQTLNNVSSLQRSKREAIREGQVSSVEETRAKRQASICTTACTAIGDFCYIPYVANTTNAVAQSTCAADGGKLPFFSTMAQYNSYYAYQQTVVNKTRFWIGIWNYSPHNATNPGIWRDTNGTGSVANFTNWCVGEPKDNFQTSKCATTVTSSCWMDMRCTIYILYPFICMCQCPTISITNGAVVINSQVPTINYTAQFQCNSGYQLVGNTTLYCINIGGGMSWNQAMPTCVTITTTTTTSKTTTHSTTTPTTITHTTTTPATTTHSTTTPTTTTTTSTPNIITTTTTPTTSTTTDTTATTAGTSASATIPITSTTPTTSPITITVLSLEPVTVAAASLIPNVSTAEFTASLDLATANGTMDNIAAASQLNTAMEIVLSSLPPAELKQLGFQRNEFVTACLFSDIPCNNDDKLTLVQIPEFLNCYAFNHRDQANLFTFERPGANFGLSIAFNIQSEEYISTMTTSGVQLFVQEQIDPILPGSMGTVYSPGFQYYITISKRIENQLSVPGRPCVTSPMEIPFNLFTNDTYYTESCLRSYLQLNIINNCGCGSAKYPLPNDNSKFCNLTIAKCAASYLASNGAKLIAEAQVACPPACRSVSFDLTTTFARLSPQQSLLDDLNVTKSSYKTNVVTVKLFFTTGTIMVYTEELNFDVMNVLANIGGSVGCIAGISMISLVEVIFMTAQLVQIVKKKGH